MSAKVAPPSYAVLRTLILEAVNDHKAGLIRIINQTLPGSTRLLLEALLTKKLTKHGTTINRYQLTLLKRCSQSTQPSQITNSLADLKCLQVLYRRVFPVMQRLALTHTGIRYYAHSVLKSEIFQMTRRTEDDRYLHLMAFIIHQYYRRHDALIDIFLKTVQRAVSATQRDHKTISYERREETTHLVQTFLGRLDDQFLAIVTTIQQIVQHKQLDNTEKIRQIKAVLVTQEPTAQQTLAMLQPLRENLMRDLDSASYYHLLEAKSGGILRRLTPILNTLTFQVSSFFKMRQIQDI